MRATLPVSIAILTFQRPSTLIRAVESVRAALLVSNATVIEVIVIDNDPDGSARSTVESIEWSILRYVHEPVPGVANARNRALDEAAGSVIVFLDDDERAGSHWPDGLIEIISDTGAALVGGPVRSVFESRPSAAIAQCGVFDRPEPDHLELVTFLSSNNLAIDLAALRSKGIRFDPAFNRTGGEDSRLSAQAARAGLDLRWSATAIVHEDVGDQRLTEDWVVRRVHSTMSNYVAAQAPLGPTTVVRTLAATGIRFTRGVAMQMIGQIRKNEAQALRGRLSRSRAAGALDGCIRVFLPSRRPAAENRHYSSS